MDELLEKWFKCEYDFFAKNMAASTFSDHTVGAYSILEIMENSLIMFIDYCYNNNLEIYEKDLGFAQFGRDSYTGKYFRVRIDPAITIELEVDRTNDVISSLSIEGRQMENGKIKYSHRESLSDVDIEKDVVQMRAKQVLRTAILHIMRDVNMDAYFVIQGINVRNYDI